MTSETRNLHVLKNLNISKTKQDIEKLKTPLRLAWKCCSVVLKIGSKIFSLQWHFKSLELAFRGSSFQNFPGEEYPRTSLHRSHLQRSYVLPPNFEFVPKPLYYELYCTDHCIKWAFKTWKYRFSVSKFKKIREAYIPGLPQFSSLSHFLERIVALELSKKFETFKTFLYNSNTFQRPQRPTFKFEDFKGIQEACNICLARVGIKLRPYQRH